MLKEADLARLQRTLDGESSPGSSGPPSPCAFFGEPTEGEEGAPPKGAHSEEAPTSAQSCTEADQPLAEDAGFVDSDEEAEESTEPACGAAAAVAGKGAPSTRSTEEEEEFNMHTLLKQSRRQRRQQQQQQQQQQDQPISLPPVDEALAAAEERVKQRQKQLEKEAAERAARMAADEVQHVSASGGLGSGLRKPAKKQQQVYVGLPVGCGWHVPLVGVEGRGGYKPAAGGGEDDNKQSPATSEKKRALTVKERERLKRKKGQSSHSTWKPETWMQLRQQFD